MRQELDLTNVLVATGAWRRLRCHGVGSAPGPGSQATDVGVSSTRLGGAREDASDTCGPGLRLRGLADARLSHWGRWEAVVAENFPEYPVVLQPDEYSGNL